jgi:hypothetical protein
MTEKSAILIGVLIGGDDEHPASGIVKIVKNMVKLIDVQISEAPDGRISLAKNFDDKTSISLGKLQGFTGSHEYPIPEEVNPDDYNTVLVWCDQFNVPIGKVQF